MRTIIGIPVSNCSKRLPNKVFLEKNGMSLFEHTYRLVESFCEAYIVTDDEQVYAECANRMIPAFKSPYFSNGLDRIRWFGHNLDLDLEDVLIDWQVDYPLFDPNYLNEAINNSDNDTFFSFAYKAENSLDKADPNFVKVAFFDTGHAAYFSRAYISEYIHVGIYGTRWPLFNHLKYMPLTELDRREHLEQIRILSFADIMIYECKPTISINTKQDWEKFLQC